MRRDDPEFGEILGALRRHDVRFVVIGGVAALAHGSPFVTEDVDITPAPDGENLQRLSDALGELEARISVEDVPEGVAFDPDGESLGDALVWNLTTRAGDLDISMVPSGTSGYADLAADTSELDIYGILVPVASLADVIRSKQAANRPRDQRALPVLREILASRHDRDR